jgi:hypothetical protein
MKWPRTIFKDIPFFDFYKYCGETGERWLCNAELEVSSQMEEALRVCPELKRAVGESIARLSPEIGFEGDFQDVFDAHWLIVFSGQWAQQINIKSIRKIECWNQYEFSGNWKEEFFGSLLED